MKPKAKYKYIITMNCLRTISYKFSLEVLNEFWKPSLKTLVYANIYKTTGRLQTIRSTRTDKVSQPRQITSIMCQ